MTSVGAIQEELIEYARREGLFQYFPSETKISCDAEQDPNFGARPDLPLRADIEDLVFLHKKIRQRKCFTVLEFGVGYSTLVMADALHKNKQEFHALRAKPTIRCNNMFQLHAVDASQHWIESCKAKFTCHEHLRDIVYFHVSGVSSLLFNGRLCHAYDTLPDIIPDFIYLDGPGTQDVKGSMFGMTFHDCPDRTVMSADPCIFEPQLLPGCYMVIDGRTNNARFLKNNFQRTWTVQWLRNRDVTTFELVEEPLGKLNEAMLKYCGLC